MKWFCLFVMALCLLMIIFTFMHGMIIWGVINTLMALINYQNYKTLRSLE